MLIIEFEKDAKYQCDICGREFKNHKALNGHKAYCGVEKIQCVNCGKYFNKCQIKKHIKVCTNVSYCKQCGKEIPHNKTFCGASCSAKYNNPHRSINKTGKQCLNCGKTFFHNKHNKFCSISCSAEYRAKLYDEQFNDGKILSAGALRTHMYKSRKHICSICSQGNIWNGKPLKFIVDHIDGNPTNNDPMNLRLVCPNCDSQLPTYKGKNKGHGRFYRRERYKRRLSY